MDNKKKRLKYIDASKGILIILLLLHHTENLINQPPPFAFGLSDNSLSPLLTPLSDAIMSFFMPAFFVITGMCTNFRCGWREFLIKNIKQLVVPTITLSFIAVLIDPLFGDASWHYDNDIWRLIILDLLSGGPWFICALLFSKLMLYALLRYLPNVMVILVSFICFVSGIALHFFGFESNVFWIRHDLLMLFFLMSGYFLKKHDFGVNKFLLFSGVVYSVLLAYFISSYDEMPHFTRSIYVPNWGSAFLLLTMSLSGSIFFLGLCRRFDLKNSALVWIGRMSLVVYLVHMPPLHGLLQIFYPVIASNYIYSSFWSVFSAIVVAVLVSGCIYWILHLPYIRVLYGIFDFPHSDAIATLKKQLKSRSQAKT